MSTKNKLTDKQEEIIQNIKDKKSNLYFLVHNSEGVPSAGVAFVYDLVEILREKGYNAFILHDEKYKTPSWMGGNYVNLPHTTFSKLKVSPIDFLFLPEYMVQAFFEDMEQNNVKLPWEVVVLSQVYDLIFHRLDIGRHWYHFGVRSVVTTTEQQKKFIDSTLRSLNTMVVNPYIHDDFTVSETPQKPFVLVNTRDVGEGEKLIKIFYQKYPQYRWLPFKFLSNSDRSKFAHDMRECCVAVWMDEISAFGTFPLECMKSGVPIIGKVPEMIPEWMGEDINGTYHTKENGIWILSKNDIAKYIAKYMDEWLTDSLNPKVYGVMAETAAKYSKENTTTQTLAAVENLLENRVARVTAIFEKQNNKKN